MVLLLSCGDPCEHVFGCVRRDVRIWLAWGHRVRGLWPGPGPGGRGEVPIVQIDHIQGVDPRHQGGYNPEKNLDFEEINKK